jgi:hypothetical protein
LHLFFLYAVNAINAVINHRFPALTTLEQLQSQFASAIFTEKAAVADVPADHLDGAMASLVHD